MQNTKVGLFYTLEDIKKHKFIFIHFHFIIIDKIARKNRSEKVAELDDKTLTTRLKAKKFPTEVLINFHDYYLHSILNIFIKIVSLNVHQQLFN